MSPLKAGELFDRVILVCFACVMWRVLRPDKTQGSTMWGCPDRGLSQPIVCPLDDMQRGVRRRDVNCRDKSHVGSKESHANEIRNWLLPKWTPVSQDVIEFKTPLAAIPLRSIAPKMCWPELYNTWYLRIIITVNCLRTFMKQFYNLSSGYLLNYEGVGGVRSQMSRIKIASFNESNQRTSVRSNGFFHCIFSA